MMVGNAVGPVTPMTMGPLTHFICYEESSLIRSNTLWNTMMVYKTFRKSTNSSLDRSTASREGKSISRASAYSSRNKASMVKTVRYCQPSTWELADHSGELCRIRDLVSTGSLLGSLLLEYWDTP